MIQHLQRDVPFETVFDHLNRDGCVVVDNLATGDTIDAIEAEMAPFETANSHGNTDFSGMKTKRTGSLVARSPASRNLLVDKTILAAVKRLFKESWAFHLHLSQIISIEPGESAQPLHRDQWAFDFFPFPRGFEVQLSAIWAMTDFTHTNGATRVVPGSHFRDDKDPPKPQEAISAEMSRGSVLIYTGSLYHGGGDNHSNAVRRALQFSYTRAWLTQEENQFLAVPREVAIELPEQILRLIGYAPAAQSLNYFGDLDEAITAIHPNRGDRNTSTRREI